MDVRSEEGMVWERGGANLLRAAGFSPVAGRFSRCSWRLRRCDALAEPATRRTSRPGEGEVIDGQTG
eukprot:3699993-Pyramimonas_sp.AAC.1